MILYFTKHTITYSEQAPLASVGGPGPTIPISHQLRSRDRQNGTEVFIIPCFIIPLFIISLFQLRSRNRQNGAEVLSYYSSLMYSLVKQHIYQTSPISHQLRSRNRQHGTKVMYSRLVFKMEPR